MIQSSFNTIKYFLTSLFLVIFFTTQAWALTKDEIADIRQEADNNKFKIITTKEGLHFRIPDDMPIETRNGIQSPIPFEEYMYGKFKEFDGHLKSIETKLDSIEKKLVSPKQDKQKLLTSNS